jgi:hypothetical protein
MYLLLYGAGRTDFDAGNIHGQVPLEGVGPENRLFWALKWQQAKRVSFGPIKSRFSGPTPSNGPNNRFAHIKIIKSKRYVIKRYIGNFMYIGFCPLYSIFCVLWIHKILYVLSGKAYTVEKCLQAESQPVVSWQVFSTPRPEIRHQSWKEGHCVGNNFKG